MSERVRERGGGTFGHQPQGRGVLRQEMQELRRQQRAKREGSWRAGSGVSWFRNVGGGRGCGGMAHRW